jgi:dihydrolipoamide dehydrogenase
MVVGSLTVETDVVVIGSGPGGYVAAIRAAQQGLDVMLVEKDKKLGGVCLNVGCVPTKALITSSDYFHVIQDLEQMGISVKDFDIDLTKMNSWKDNIILKMEHGIRSLFEKHGIEVIQGVASFKDKHTLAISGQSDVETISFKHAIVATGSSPIQIPGFDFDGDKIISSNEGISLQEVPKKLIIIGGGYIGTELGTVYGKLGSEVHIIEGSDQLIGVIDKDIVDVVARRLPEFGINIHYNAKATGVEKTQYGVVVSFESEGKTQTIDADKVMVVVGRKPNSKGLGLEEIGVNISDRGFVEVDKQQKTNVDTILAIGDLVGNPMLAHKASREGKIAGEVVAGKKSYFDNQVIPAVVFNDPEIVSVGLQESEAKEQNLDVIVKKFPYAALARAHMFGREDGFIKLVADKKTKLVLGVHAVGPHVSEIIAEATLAIEMGATVEDLSLTIHPHPTISEGLSEVAEIVEGHAIHIYTPPKNK